MRLMVGELVLLSRRFDDQVEVTVRAGGSGDAVSDAEVRIYQYDWRRGHRLLATRRTGADGTVTVAVGGRNGRRFSLVARRGDDIAVDPTYLSLTRRRPERRREAALVYTDRSVYRPGQEVLWKVVAYGGGFAEGRYEVERRRAARGRAARRQRRAGRDRRGHHQRLRLGVGPLHAAARPAAGRLAACGGPSRRRGDPGGGVQAADLRGGARRARRAAAPQPVGPPGGRGALLLRAAGRRRQLRLAGDPRAGLAIGATGGGRRRRRRRRRWPPVAAS